MKPYCKVRKADVINISRFSCSKLCVCVFLRGKTRYFFLKMCVFRHSRMLSIYWSAHN